MLSTIKTSKSAGHDRIPGKLLRDAAEVIAPSLSAIFNASINTGIFPQDFKIAIISPIHKAGSKTNCDNYRPISVLSSVAKIYEKLVTEQLEIYLERLITFLQNNKQDLGKITLHKLLYLTSRN